MLEPFPHFLTVLTFLPLVGALVVRFIGRDSALRIRWVALVFSLLTLVLAILAFVQFDPDTSGFQFSESHPWIASPPINYTMGMDGLSLLLVLLTAFLTPLSVLASWKGITIRVKEFHLFLLALETGMIGVFVSLDLFLFFVFWEVMLIPMYFLIGVWGHERRIYAAVKFILYTMVGSALMLVGILYLYSVTGSFDFQTILRDLPGKWASLPTWLLPAQTWLFLAFFIAFAIKVPMFPFHTWLPDAHVEAPTAGSVILAGVLLKMGTYGMLRFCLPLFPQASKDLAPIVCVVAIIGILYGALVAMVQPDMKKLVAYSSVAHMGFVVLGIFAFNMNGLEGAIYQMCNHGVSTGALFLLVGMLYERRHTRLISEFGGLATSLPVYSTFFMIVALSSLGLPMLNGFVGEFLIIVGAFHARAVYGALAAIGVVLAAVYLLWMYQRVFFGEVTNPKNRDLPDCDAREKLILVSLVLVMLWMGIYPNPFLRRLDRSTLATIERVESTGTQMAGRAPAELPPQRSLRTRRKKDSASSMVSVVNSRSANERAQEGGQSR
ncbi:MAG: NADH-quinone oxidoreductase subunit M [Terriglobia bacterium]|jgi:NADH-quinone oxidoreductase subunit M